MTDSSDFIEARPATTCTIYWRIIPMGDLLNVGLTLGQRRRRWPSVEPTLDYGLVLTYVWSTCKVKVGVAHAWKRGWNDHVALFKLSKWFREYIAGVYCASTVGYSSTCISCLKIVLIAFSSYLYCLGLSYSDLLIQPLIVFSVDVGQKSHRNLIRLLFLVEYSEVNESSKCR